MFTCKLMTAEGSTCEKIEAWWDTAQDLSFFLLSETSSDVVLKCINVTCEYLLLLWRDNL
jgi:hypothetical protein